MRARARTIDGSLLTFQDAAMKVADDGQVQERSAVLRALRSHPETTLRYESRVSRRNAETLRRGEYPAPVPSIRKRMRHDVTGLTEHADKRCTH